MTSDYLIIDDVPRPTTNNLGRPIHPTEEGIRNFWAWFGASKCVDADGRPLVVFHGTDTRFDVFDVSRQGSKSDQGWFAAGFYFTPDAHFAHTFGPHVLAGYARIISPYDWREQEDRGLFQNDRHASREKQRELRAQGHDGVLVYSEQVTLAPEQNLSAEQYQLLAQASPLVASLGKARIEQTLRDNRYTPNAFIAAYGREAFRAMPKDRQLSEVVVFSPLAIKAIDNTGRFDPTNSSLADHETLRASLRPTPAWFEQGLPVTDPSQASGDFDFVMDGLEDEGSSLSWRLCDIPIACFDLPDSPDDLAWLKDCITTNGRDYEAQRLQHIRDWITGTQGGVSAALAQNPLIVTLNTHNSRPDIQDGAHRLIVAAYEYGATHIRALCTQNPALQKEAGLAHKQAITTDNDALMSPCP